jgi:hypothetical protein
MVVSEVAGGGVVLAVLSVVTGSVVVVVSGQKWYDAIRRRQN